MVLTRSEKEELVKQLYEEGKTVHEIAKEVHMSFGLIGNIIRKATGDYNKDNNNEVKKSKETEALKLFQEGKTPVEAAIILNISSDEAEGLYLGLYLGYLRCEKSLASIIFLYVLVVMSSIVILTNVSYAQNETANDVTELKNVLFDYYPGVIVEYGTDSVVALKADEEFLLGTNGTLAPFWEAVDRVEGYGYVLDEMSTSGMGSQGNPTRYYAIFSR